MQHSNDQQCKSAVGPSSKLKTIAATVIVTFGLTTSVPAIAEGCDFSGILDVLNKIFSLTQKISDQAGVIVEQIKTEIETISTEAQKTRDVWAEESGKTRQQTEDIFVGDSMPSGSYGDLVAMGTAGGINKRASISQAQLGSDTKSIAQSLDKSNSPIGFYKDVNNWVRNASDEEKAQVLTPPLFSAGEVLTEDQRNAADRNAKLSIGLKPIAKMPDGTLDSTSGAQYEVARTRYNAIQALAYDSYRKYDMADLEIKEMQDVLSQMTPTYINGMNMGSTAKSQLQLSAVHAKIALSAYQADLRRERLLAVQTIEASRGDLDDQLKIMQKTMPIGVINDGSSGDQSSGSNNGGLANAKGSENSDWLDVIRKWISG